MSDEQAQLDDQEWLTTAQVVEKYGVGKNTVYSWWSKEKVITRVIDGVRYVSSSSIDAMYERQKEDKQNRAVMFSQLNKLATVSEPPIIDPAEVARLRKQVQELTQENDRLKGREEAREQELGRIHGLLKELVVQAR